MLRAKARKPHARRSYRSARCRTSGGKISQNFPLWYLPPRARAAEKVVQECKKSVSIFLRVGAAENFRRASGKLQGERPSPISREGLLLGSFGIEYSAVGVAGLDLLRRVGPELVRVAGRFASKLPHFSSNFRALKNPPDFSFVYALRGRDERLVRLHQERLDRVAPDPNAALRATLTGHQLARTNELAYRALCYLEELCGLRDGVGHAVQGQEISPLVWRAHGGFWRLRCALERFLLTLLGPLVRACRVAGLASLLPRGALRPPCYFLRCRGYSCQLATCSAVISSGTGISSAMNSFRRS